MSLRDLLGMGREEEYQPEPEPEPQYATMEQMQAMVAGVSQQLQENLVSLMRGSREPEEQKQAIPQIEEPTLEQISEAYDVGDTKRALALQAQRDLARDQRYMQQIYQLRQEGQEAFSHINNQLVGNVVPDYKEYEKDVIKKMDELGLSKEFRSNHKVLQLLTNSVKGEKIEEIVQARLEAEKRQSNQARTGAPSYGGRTQRLNSEPRAVLSEEAELALQSLGKDREQFARERGHGSWADFEDTAAIYQAAKRGEGNYVPKWRRK